jgi:esterase/lipase superfamily enzyme
MLREYHNWYSEHLGRNMELLVFGHSGTPVLVFPTSRGRFFEYENAGMIGALTGKIDAGELRVFCVDSVDAESWYNRSLHPHERVRRHIAYEDYILYEVVPLMKRMSGAEQIITTGCGLGAYHAFNFAMRHPDVVNSCIAMSGPFDMKSFMDGYFDNDFYFNHPVDYLPNMNDAWFLDRYKQMRIVLGVADWDSCLGENQRIADILGRKGIPHWLDVWTGAECQEWSLWQSMAAKFF